MIANETERQIKKLRPSKGRFHGRWRSLEKTSVRLLLVQKLSIRGTTIICD